MKLKISGGDIKAVQGDTGHAQANMVTDVYSHIMDSSRKHLAQQMEAQFFLTSPESKKAASQLPMDSSMKQLIQLLKSSPEIADPLLHRNHSCLFPNVPTNEAPFIKWLQKYQKSLISYEIRLLMELLGRFELPTSSLPRMRSTD